MPLPRPCRTAVLVGTAVALSAAGLGSAGDAAAVGTTITALSSLGPVAAPDARRVVTANDFVESVGVNVHTYYDDTAYRDTARVRSLLQGLGVRHVRDGLVPNRPDEVTALRSLGATGIRSLLIMGGTRKADAQSVDPAQLEALDAVRPYVDGVEPSNEYDCSGDDAWAAHQRDYSKALVGALQARDDLRSVGVVASSFCRPDSVAQFGSVTGTAAMGNAHSYANGQPPEFALASRLPQWNESQDASLPMALTETGYHNAVNARFPAVGVSEQTAADYTVRTLLEASRLGVARTYLYELLDERPEPGLHDPEQHFGLVRADGSVKPAYTGVRNLLADLAHGPVASVKPTGPRSSVVASVRGGGSLLRSMTITDPVGGGETLALWLATPVENAAHQRLAEVARPVRVQLRGVRTAVARQPSRSNAATTLGTGAAFTVGVTGGVTLLHLAPAATTIKAPKPASCASLPGYGALAGKLGVIASDSLAPTGWTGSPAAAGTRPDGVAGGSQVSADDQSKRISVPGRPTSWTIAFWQRTDDGTADFSTFARAIGTSGPMAGGLLRTYDMAGDAPSHMQLSGYGLPAGDAGHGAETWGQALEGSWHLVSLAVGGTSARMSVDGVPAGTATSGTGALTGVDVGSLSGAFRGAVAGLTVYKRALSSDELGRLATTSPGSCQPIAAK